MNGGTTTFTDVSILGNLAFQLAGGLAVWGGGDAVLVGSTEIAENVGGEAAGGVLVTYASLTGGVVRDNIGGERAGGVLVAQGDVTDVVMTGNRVDGLGDGLFVLVGAAEVGGGSILRNLGAERGGGAWVLGGSLTFDGAARTPTTTRRTTCSRATPSSGSARAPRRPARRLAVGHEPPL